MEADWEIEIGSGAPVIDASWQGFVDLGLFPEKAVELAEVQDLPCLAAVLVRLNSSGSPLFTTKCDLWPLESVDPYEFDAEAQSAVCGFAAYIDLLPRSARAWSDTDSARALCKEICKAIRLGSLRCCRVDLIIRAAKGISCTIGVTAYVAACGPTVAEARAQIGVALAALADAIRGPKAPDLNDQATINNRASSSIG